VNPVNMAAQTTYTLPILHLALLALYPPAYLVEEQPNNVSL
jgi:hypothetical protein